MSDNYENPQNTWCFRKSRSNSLEEKDNKSWVEKKPEYMKKWRKENKEKMREYSKKYREEGQKKKLENVINGEVQRIENEIVELEKNEILLKYKKLCERKECCLKLLED